MQLLTPSDSIALLFSATAISIVGKQEDSRYVIPALKLAFEGQDENGCWPLGRVIGKHKATEGARIEISTYEVAWAAAFCMLNLTKRMKIRITSELIIGLVDKIYLSHSYAERSLLELPGDEEPKKGWCSDHSYNNPMIESWTSATVINFFVTFFDLVNEANREIILDSFVTVRPTDYNWPSWLRWEKYMIESEPDSDKSVLSYIDTHIIRSIKEDPKQLPASDKSNVSLLLFGPPGTSKTTIVKGIADALKWPVVLLSPGDFIKDGLEFIENQARNVFERLMDLSKAVVLFDECDELFRDRKPSSATEQTRGITAFVTASMLPKLQELHDRGKVLFVVCTNHIETLDKAILRGGRIDHIIGIGWPDPESRKRVITQHIKRTIPFGDKVIETVINETDRFIRSEIIRLCDLIMKNYKATSEKDAKKFVKETCSKFSSGITIENEAAQSFLNDQKKLSRPYTEG